MRRGSIRDGRMHRIKCCPGGIIIRIDLTFSQGEWQFMNRKFLPVIAAAISTMSFVAFAQTSTTEWVRAPRR